MQNVIRSNLNWIENVNNSWDWKKKASLISLVAIIYKTEKIISDYYQDQYNLFNIPAIRYVPKTVIEAAKIALITICAFKIWNYSYVPFGLGIAASIIIVADRIINPTSKPQSEPEKSPEKEQFWSKEITWLKPDEISYPACEVNLYPDEVIKRILIFLSAKKSGRCAMVCKQWYHLLYHPNNIKIMFSFFEGWFNASDPCNTYYAENLDMVSFCSRFNRFINNFSGKNCLNFFVTKFPKNLKIDCPRLCFPELKTDEILRLLNIFSNDNVVDIKYFKIFFRDCDDISYANELMNALQDTKKYVSLKYLSLQKLPVLCEKNLPKLLKSHFFEKIILSDTTISDDSLRSLPSSLTTLCLFDCKFSEIILSDCLKKMKPLRKIKLSSFGITGSSLTDNLEKLSSLKILKLGYNCSDEVLSKIFYASNCLEKVHLSFNKISGKCFENLTSYLRVLNLNSCFYLDESFLSKFLQIAKNLQILRLGWTPISGECLTKIPLENNLEHLDLLYCKALNEDKLKEAFKGLNKLVDLNLSFTHISGSCLRYIPDDAKLENSVYSIDPNYTRNPNEEILKENLIKLYLRFPKLRHLVD